MTSYADWLIRSFSREAQPSAGVQAFACASAAAKMSWLFVVHGGQQAMRQSIYEGQAAQAKA
jgi:hypothetical protein